MKDPLIQFEAVAIDTILGCTISGIQSHTTGPSDSPKTAPNKKRPANISGSLNEDSSQRKKPVITSPQAIPANSEPKIKIVLLPNLVKRNEVAKMANICSKLNREVISIFSSPLTDY